MSTVWIVECFSLESYDNATYIYGVFATQEKAKEAVEDFDCNGEEGLMAPEEYTLDDRG